MAIELETLHKEGDATNRRRILLSVLSVILLAVPVWWRTTEIYRAPLPFDRIREWSKSGVLDATVLFEVNLVIEHPRETDEVDPLPDVTMVAQSIEKGLRKVYADVPTPELVGEGSRPPGRVNADLKVSFRVHGSQSRRPQGFIEGAEDRNGRYLLHVVCKPSKSTSAARFLVKSEREMMLETVCTKDVLINRAVTLIGGLFADEQKSYLRSAPTTDMTGNANHDNMRTVKYASQYQLTFSLLNGDPGDVALDWDVRPAVEDFIFPFLNAVSNLSDFAVSSQIQHYASLPIQPEQVQNDGKEYFALRPHALPHFINSAEWNLASVVSSAPPINFILFVPPFSQSPLRLLKSNGEFLKTNAFLIPQWGGILVRDPPQDKGSAYRLSRSELHPIMEIFVSQLRSLLGVKEIVIPNVKDLLPDVRVEYDPAPHVGLTKWELDRLTRERAVQNLVDAVTTLNSLATLIFDLENMVVLDHIQTEVLAALDAVDKGYKALEDSSFEEAARYARLAITSAESAFFDPTMVSMLYFPDEHKYAVYMPLFVPVAVPLLIASIKELKAWKQGRRGHKAKYE